MEEVKTNVGMLRFTRNLSLIATAGCLVVGSLIASDHSVYPLSPMYQSICGAVIDACAIYPAMIGYDNHKKLKKLK